MLQLKGNAKGIRFSVELKPRLMVLEFEIMFESYIYIYIGEFTKQLNTISFLLLWTSVRLGTAI